MRYTYRILISLGLACLLYAFLNLNIGASIDVANRRTAFAARQAADSMTPAELHRVFGMPENTADQRVWMEWHIGRDRVAGVLNLVFFNLIAAAALGITLLTLGFIERVNQRGKSAPHQQRIN